MQITMSDAWLISVKNRIREYCVAANSIALLPVAQQESAKEFVKRIDDFIRNRIFPKVREMAMIRNAEIDDEGLKGHGMVYRRRYVFCDYYYFKNSSSEEDVYIGLSPITTIPTENVLPALAKAAKDLENLVRCMPNDILVKRLERYLYTRELMSAICKGNVIFDKEDKEKGLFYCHTNIEGSSLLRSVTAKFTAENYELRDVFETQRGIDFGGSIRQPVINIVLRTHPVPPECKYAVKSKDGKFLALLPLKGEINAGYQLTFEFPVSAFASEEFNYRFNRVIYPEFKNRERNEL